MYLVLQLCRSQLNVAELQYPTQTMDEMAPLLVGSRPSFYFHRAPLTPLFAVHDRDLIRMGVNLVDLRPFDLCLVHTFIIRIQTHEYCKILLVF